MKCAKLRTANKSIFDFIKIKTVIIWYIINVKVKMYIILGKAWWILECHAESKLTICTQRLEKVILCKISKLDKIARLALS